MKVAIYKDLGFRGGKKRPKMGVVIADFSKFEVRLKALSVRFWGIPERGLKPLQIKGFIGSKEE